MAQYEDLLKEIGPPPEAATQYNVLGFPFNTQAYNDAVIKKKLYEQEAQARMSQRLSPARDMTLGQVAGISGHPADQIAAPDQMQRMTEPSQVPTYRYMPTMTQGPEVQGPYDIRQEPDRDGVVQPITQHYPAPGGEVETVPQLRQSFNKPIGALSGPEQGPDISYNKLNYNAPANLYQQQLGASALERETKWPRNFGSGAATFNTRLAARTQGLMSMGMPEAQARAQAQLEMTGGTEDERGSLSRSRDTRSDYNDMSTQMGPRRQAEIERHNSAMENFRRQSMSMSDRWHQKSQEAMNNRDEVAWGRLNEQRYWHDETLKFMTSIDKGDIHSDEQQQAAQQAMDIIQRMDERPATPQELSFLEQLMGPRKRYTYQGRPPVGPTAPTQKGTAPPMSRSQSQGGSTVQKQSTTGQAPVAVQSDAEYEKLPSGTTFTGPDGKTRVKP